MSNNNPEEEKEKMSIKSTIESATQPKPDTHVGKQWQKIANAAPELQGLKNRALNPPLTNIIERNSPSKVIKGFANYGKLTNYVVMDCGCGWGEMISILGEKGADVIGYDRSDEMVEKARKHFPDRQYLYEHELMKLESGMREHYDIVMSNLVLCVLEREEQDALLRRMTRMLKPDGTIFISICHPDHCCEKEGVVSVRDVPKDFDKNKKTYYKKTLKEVPITFIDIHWPEEQLIQLFKDHGLEVIDTENSDTLGQLGADGKPLNPDFKIYALKKLKLPS